MRVLSLFSGIEAASLAWRDMGWEIVAFSEIDPFACKLLAHHYPATPNLGDVTKITEAQIRALGHIDMVVFGSPCQDLSLAGQRKGFDGARSSLFFTAIGIVRWARIHCRCRFSMWENVVGAFSSNQGRDFAAVVGEMAGLTDVPVPPQGWGSEGAAVGALGMLEWCILDAQWFGVAQRRRRVFALADFGDWTNRPPILLEPHSLRGDSPPRREPGQDVAGTIAARADGGGYPRTDEACAGYIQPVAFGGNNQGGGAIDVATACRSKGGSGHNDFESETFVVQPIVATLDASYGRLQGCSGQDANHGHSHLVPIAFDSRQDCVSSTEVFGALGSSRPQSQAVYVTGDITHKLKAEGFDASEDGSGRGRGQPIINTLAIGVRRLTPLECERLMGVPDGYTNIPVRGKPAKDGPRYKALGNSWAIPVIRSIGERIEAALNHK